MIQQQADLAKVIHDINDRQLESPNNRVEDSPAAPRPLVRRQNLAIDANALPRRPMELTSTGVH